MSLGDKIQFHEGPDPSPSGVHSSPGPGPLPPHLRNKNAFVSCCRCNELRHTYGLKTIHIYDITFLELRSIK